MRYLALNVNLVFIYIVICCSFSNQILSQPRPINLPELKLIAYSYVTPESTLTHRSSFLFGGPVMYNVSIDLKLTEEKRQAYEDAFMDIKEFVEKFEKERDELESQYNDSRAEEKIEKAKKLLEYITKSEEEWQKFILPLSDKWEGEYYMILDLMGFIKFESKGLAKIDLINMSVSPGKPTGISELEGEIDGNLTININIGLPDGEIDIVDGSGSYAYLDKLVGKSNYYSLIITEQEFIIKEGSMDVDFGIPGWIEAAFSSETHGDQTTSRGTFISLVGYGELYGTDTRIKGYTVMLNPYTGMYERKDISKAISRDKIYQLLIFEYVDPELEWIDFQAYKNKYFKYYVNAIDETRTDQYGVASDMTTKELKAENTFRELLNAKVYGQLIGIDESVYTKLKLILRIKQSLFDKWFELWFQASDKKWGEKEKQSTNDVSLIGILNNRLNNALIFFQRGQISASDGLMVELKLFEGSVFLCARIIQYFQKANKKYCTDLIDGDINIVNEYNVWWKEMYLLAMTIGNDEVVSLIHNNNCILKN